MPNNSQRAYGIDVARILAMFFVCVAHVGGWWKGVPNAPTVLDRCAAVSYCSLTYTGVNLFMLITGYLGIHHTWKVQSFLRLWGQVAFYTIGCFIAALLLHDAPLSASRYFSLIFPIPFANGYWYFTAYAGAFFLFPYLNKCFVILSKEEQKKLLITLFTVICIFGFYNKHVWGGYNAVWMLVMYLTGAYLKLHPVTFKNRHLIAIYLTTSITAGLIFSLDSYLRHTHDFSLPIPGLDYTSPLTVCASIAGFIVCVRMRPTSPLVQQILQTLAPLMFAVYLIHTHPSVSRHFGDFTKWLAQYSHYGWWHIPVGSILIFSFCTIIEFARAKLFKVITLCIRALRKQD